MKLNKQHFKKLLLASALLLLAYIAYNYTQDPISIKFERTDKYPPKFAIINRDSLGLYMPYILTVKNHRLTKEEFNGVIDFKYRNWRILENNDSNLSYDKRGQTKEERRSIRDEESFWKQLTNLPDRLYRTIVRDDYEIIPLCSQEFVFYTIHLYSFDEMKISFRDFKPREYRHQLEVLDKAMPISIAHLNIDSLYQSDQMKPLTVLLKNPLPRCPRYVKFDNMDGENPIYVNYMDSVRARNLTEAKEIVEYLWSVYDTDTVFNPEKGE